MGSFYTTTGELAMAQDWMPEFDLDYYLGPGWQYLADEGRYCLRAVLGPCPDPIPSENIEAFSRQWAERSCEVAEQRRQAGREVSRYAIQLLFHETKGAHGLSRRLINSKRSTFDRHALLHHAYLWLQDRRRELLESECGHSEHKLKTWRKIQRVIDAAKAEQQIRRPPDILAEVMRVLAMKPNTLLSYLRQFEPQVEFGEGVHGMFESTPLDLLESDEAAAICEQCFDALSERDQRLVLHELEGDLTELSDLEQRQALKLRRALEQQIRRRLQETPPISKLKVRTDHPET